MGTVIAWLNANKGAIVAFAAALGIFAHNMGIPFAPESGTIANDAFIVLGILGAVFHAYALGVKPTNG